MNKEINVNELEKIVGYTFKDKGLALCAISHSSYVNELKINRYDDYERLEFLGDAVLEFVVSEFLINKFTNKKEGELTKIRAALVCEPTLSKVIRDNKIDSLVLLGKGEENTGGRMRDSIMCDVFEAIVAAIYLDAGIERARKHIEHFLLQDWDKKMLFKDSKTRLQELLQKDGHTIAYKNLEEIGPQNERIYVEALIVDGKVASKGKGRNRKSAQQEAAYFYLTKHC